MPLKVAHLQLDRPDVAQDWHTLNHRFTFLQTALKQVQEGIVVASPREAKVLEKEYKRVYGAICALLPTLDRDW